VGHDEDISREEIIRRNIVSEEDYILLEKYTRALFLRGTEMASDQGLILVDTKYEFGKVDDKIHLIDEIHTPDSSRYFYKEGFEERQKNHEQQKQLSKEFVRKWLIDNGFQGKEDQLIPEMTPQFVKSISDRYIELYEQITGDQFIKHDQSNAQKRLENNIIEALNRLN
jgi:phosphoribosylaminoimidazole-succinocarboxamide synthase